MNTIKSFLVDHDKLQKGMYISRVDGDVATYDIRMKLPNAGDYLENPEIHSIEHLFATFARNSEFANSVVYVGPMGCRTGFYLLLRNDVSKQQALELTKSAMRFIVDFEGEMPGSRREQCGNFQDHDLAGAKKVAGDMLVVLNDWNQEKMKYET